VTPIERFTARYVVQPDGCWQWTGVTGGSTARYGYFTWDGRKRPAHRFAYEHFVGPIPPGLEIDHQCGNKLCVNPQHLEAVTHAVNRERAKLLVCRAGLHDLTDPENTHPSRRGCYRCWKDRANERYQRKAEAMKAGT
jgi:HNH endonuclease